jgi:hypothetical protein
MGLATFTESFLDTAIYSNFQISQRFAQAFGW